MLIWFQWAVVIVYGLGDADLYFVLIHPSVYYIKGLSGGSGGDKGGTKTLVFHRTPYSPLNPLVLLMMKYQKTE